MVGPLDDLDRPFPDRAQRPAKLVADIATIGEDVPEPGVPADDLGQDQRRTITVLHVGGIDNHINKSDKGAFAAVRMMFDANSLAVLGLGRRP